MARTQRCFVCALPRRRKRSGCIVGQAFRIIAKYDVRPPRDVRQPCSHHLPRRGVGSQIASVKVWQRRRPQIIHQPFIFRSVDCLAVQRQKVFMFSCLCCWLVDNITNTVLAQCIVDVKCYSSITNYPPMLLLIVSQSGSVLPVVPACVTTITQPGGRDGEVSTSPTL